MASQYWIFHCEICVALFAVFHSFLELHLQVMDARLCLPELQFNKAVGNCRERPIGQLNWWWWIIHQIQVDAWCFEREFNIISTSQGRYTAKIN
jgi:hypothetical protein